MNGVVESGRTPWSRSGSETMTVRPVPTASVRARPTGIFRSSATSAARRQARTGTSAPMSTLLTWAAWKPVPNTSIGPAARNVGSGSQTSNASRGNWSGGVP